MSLKINIRKGSPKDWNALAEIFHIAVRRDAVAYTEAQREAWSPASKAGPDWSLRMSKQSVMVADAGDEGLVGFMTTELNGYLDCAYILGTYKGQGIFRRLYEPLEAEQREHGQTRMYVHASLHARPAFEAMGYSIIKPETVEMTGGLWLPRFAMEKIF